MLKELRLRNGFTQEQLAKMINSTTACICMYEQKKRKPRLEKIALLALALKVPIEDIVNCFSEKVG